MKKKLLILGMLGLGFLNLIGQEIHTAAEIFKIMENSSITYELIALEKEILPKDRSGNLNYNQYYRVIDGDQILTYKYEVDSNVQSYLTKAEDYFRENRLLLARGMYLEALRADSTYYEVMTYIGQTYGMEGDLDNAIAWYKKTIALNYIDYMAHWFLAEAYKKQGELDKAVDEITIAMTLNRNNPRIAKSLKSIYELKKLNVDDWTFTPQIIIDSIDVHKVRISFDSDWLGYALVKAIWKYEPGYRKSMGVNDGSYSTTEEKECFVSLIPTFDKKILKKHPEFRALQLALDKKMINAYIFYEIILPEYPFVAHQLPTELILDIKDYVIEVRGKQK